MADLTLETLVDIDVAAGVVKTDKLVNEFAKALRTVFATEGKVTADVEVLPNVNLGQLRKQLSQEMKSLRDSGLKGADFEAAKKQLVDIMRALKAIESSQGGVANLKELKRLLNEKHKGGLVGTEDQLRKDKEAIRALRQEVLNLRKEIQTAATETNILAYNAKKLDLEAARLQAARTGAALSRLKSHKPGTFQQVGDVLSETYNNADADAAERKKKANQRVQARSKAEAEIRAAELAAYAEEAKRQQASARQAQIDSNRNFHTRQSDRTYQLKQERDALNAAQDSANKTLQARRANAKYLRDQERAQNPGRVFNPIAAELAAYAEEAKRSSGAQAATQTAAQIAEAAANRQGLIARGKEAYDRVGGRVLNLAPEDQYATQQYLKSEIEALKARDAELEKQKRSVASNSAEYRKYTAEQKEAGKSISAMSGHLSTVNRELQGHTGLLYQASLATRQFLRYAILYGSGFQALQGISSTVGGALDLDKSLKGIQAITQSSAEGLASIEASIKGVVSTSQFGVKEVADAAETLAQAGVKLEELPKVLTAVSRVASTTGADMKATADVLTSLLDVYHQTYDAAQLADQLTQAVNISKLTIDGLKTIISLGASTAQGVGLKSEHLLGAAATLSNRGVKDSTIATGLRETLLELFSPDDKMIRYLQERYAAIGEASTAAFIKARFAAFQNEQDPVASALLELRRLGVGGAGRAGFSRVTDIRAENVLIPLLRNLESYTANTAKVTQGGGAALGAATQMQALSNALSSLGGTLTTLTHDLLSDFLPSMTKAVSKVRDLTEGFRKDVVDSKSERSGSGATSVGAGAIAGLLAALKTPGGPLSKLFTGVLVGSGAAAADVAAQSSGNKTARITTSAAEVAATAATVAALAPRATDLFNKLTTWFKTIRGGAAAVESAATVAEAAVALTPVGRVLKVIGWIAKLLVAGSALVGGAYYAARGQDSAGDVEAARERFTRVKGERDKTLSDFAPYDKAQKGGQAAQVEQADKHYSEASSRASEVLGRSVGPAAQAALVRLGTQGVEANSPEQQKALEELQKVIGDITLDELKANSKQLIEAGAKLAASQATLSSKVEQQQQELLAAMQAAAPTELQQAQTKAFRQLSEEEQKLITLINPATTEADFGRVKAAMAKFYAGVYKEMPNQLAEQGKALAVLARASVGGGNKEEMERAFLSLIQDANNGLVDHIDQTREAVRDYIRAHSREMLGTREFGALDKLLSEIDTLRPIAEANKAKADATAKAKKADEERERELKTRNEAIQANTSSNVTEAERNQKLQTLGSAGDLARLTELERKFQSENNLDEAAKVREQIDRISEAAANTGWQKALAEVEGILAQAGHKTLEGDVALHPNAPQSMQFFMGKGLSKEAAAALTGGFMQESTLDPTKVGPGNHYGLPQWSEERQKDIKALNGGELPTTMSKSLEAIWNELQTTERGALEALKNAKTLDEAIAAAASYERYGQGEAGRRGEYAKTIYGADAEENKFRRAQRYTDPTSEEFKAISKIATPEQLDKLLALSQTLQTAKYQPAQTEADMAKYRQDIASRDTGAELAVQQALLTEVERRIHNAKINKTLETDGVKLAEERLGIETKIAELTQHRGRDLEKLPGKEVDARYRAQIAAAQDNAKNLVDEGHKENLGHQKSALSSLLRTVETDIKNTVASGDIAALAGLQTRRRKIAEDLMAIELRILDKEHVFHTEAERSAYIKEQQSNLLAKEFEDTATAINKRFEETQRRAAEKPTNAPFSNAETGYREATGKAFTPEQQLQIAKASLASLEEQKAAAQQALLAHQQQLVQATVAGNQPGKELAEANISRTIQAINNLDTAIWQFKGQIENLTATFLHEVKSISSAGVLAEFNKLNPGFTGLRDRLEKNLAGTLDGITGLIGDFIGSGFRAVKDINAMRDALQATAQAQMQLYSVVYSRINMLQAIASSPTILKESQAVQTAIINQASTAQQAAEAAARQQLAITQAKEQRTMMENSLGGQLQLMISQATKSFAGEMIKSTLGEGLKSMLGLGGKADISSVISGGAINARIVNLPSSDLVGQSGQGLPDLFGGGQPAAPNGQSQAQGQQGGGWWDSLTSWVGGLFGGGGDTSTTTSVPGQQTTTSGGGASASSSISSLASSAKTAATSVETLADSSKQGASGIGGLLSSLGQGISRLFGGGGGGGGGLLGGAGLGGGIFGSVMGIFGSIASIYSTVSNYQKSQDAYDAVISAANPPRPKPPTLDRSQGPQPTDTNYQSLAGYISPTNIAALNAVNASPASYVSGNAPGPAVQSSGISSGSQAIARSASTSGGRDPVNIRIVNAVDSSVVHDYLSSSGGERVVLNTLRRNAAAIQQIIKGR